LLHNQRKGSTLSAEKEVIARLMKDRDVVISTIKAIRTNHELGHIGDITYNQIMHAFEMELLKLEETILRAGGGASGL
jgi:hypothetical protein